MSFVSVLDRFRLIEHFLYIRADGSIMWCGVRYFATHRYLLYAGTMIYAYMKYLAIISHQLTQFWIPVNVDQAWALLWATFCTAQAACRIF